MKSTEISLRVTGSALVIVAYFVILHVNSNIGVILNMIGDGISLPYFIATKSWDVVIMMSFLLMISLSALM